MSHCGNKCSCWIIKECLYGHKDMLALCTQFPLVWYLCTLVVKWFPFPFSLCWMHGWWRRISWLRGGIGYSLNGEIDFSFDVYESLEEGCKKEEKEDSWTGPESISGPFARATMTIRSSDQSRKGFGHSSSLVARPHLNNRSTDEFARASYQVRSSDAVYLTYGWRWTVLMHWNYSFGNPSMPRRFTKHRMRTL